MKIKIDENIPISLMPVLSGLGHVVDCVADEGLAGNVDAEVWLAAQSAERFFITQDLDFADLRKFCQERIRGFYWFVCNTLPGRRLSRI
jgi:predicted nuclease of predicted toxin-antitoxin system